MKLNLASGQRPFKEGWTNIDIKDQGYKVDIIADVKSLPMIPDESVDIIVAHHLLEHIAIHDLEAYLVEWRRVLKLNGVLAVFVPDIKAIDEAWLNGRIGTYIHNVNTFGAYQSGIEDLHKWGYDFNELVDRVSCKDQMGIPKYNWAVSSINETTLKGELYSGSDCALDWWILSVQFVKK